MKEALSKENTFFLVSISVMLIFPTFAVFAPVVTVTKYSFPSAVMIYLEKSEPTTAINRAKITD
jgi:hypothetical protein